MTDSNYSPNKQMAMNEKTSSRQEIPNEQITRNALLGAAVLTAIGLFSFIGGLSIAKINSWQDYFLLGAPMSLFILGLISIVLLRRGKILAGVSLIFIVNLITPVVAILFQREIGLAVFVYALTSTTLIIWWIMPRSTYKWAVSLEVLVLVFIVVIDWINPSIRINPADELTAFFYGASAILVAVFLIQLIYLSWGLITHSVSSRLTALILVVTIPLLIGITAYISVRAGNEIETQALRNLEQNNKSLATNVSTWLELHVRTVQGMATLPDIKSMDAARQKTTLLAIASTHPNLFLVHTTDLNGINVARNDDADLNDYNDRAWFLGAKSGAPITFEALISRTIGKPALNMSTPIYDGSGKIVGVASIVSELSEISKEVLGNEEGQGIIYIVDAKNRVVAHPDPSYTEGELLDLSAYPPVAALSEGKTGKLTFTDENNVTWVAYVDRLDNGWGIVAQEPEAELLAPVRQFQTVSIILILIGSGVLFALAWFAVRRSLQPIGELTTTVSAIAAGDLSRVAEVKSQDEIGVLASTFNEMTAKLRETLVTLEKRVAERTAKMERRNLDLALAAEVGQTVSQVRELNEMLKDAAEIIREFFGLYYVQVYLVNPTQTELVLQFGTGEVGKELMSRKHHLPLNAESINGRAATTKRSVVIADTAASAFFRPNPLLPNTRSEVAVPLLVGNTLVGVLDVQSEQVGHLDADALLAFEPMAGQMAVAVQNTRLVAETQQARAEVEALVRQLTHSGWEDYMDGIHKPEKSGFVFEENNIAPWTGQEKPAAEGALIAPIEIAGESLGSLVVELQGVTSTSQTEELINTVARQVAQQIENLRLLDSADRFRYEAEQATRRLTHEGWQEYTDVTKGTGYIYDLNQVRPYERDEMAQAEETGFNLPLKVGDETIGKLILKGVKASDTESVDIASAVAERLSTHIEGLRLSMQTEQALTATKKQAQREQALRQITSAVRGSTDPATILRTAARELGSIMGRQTVVQLETVTHENEPTPPVETSSADGGK